MSQSIGLFGLVFAILIPLALVSAQIQTISPSLTVNHNSRLVQSNASQYSQYYQMVSGPAPSNRFSAPEQYDIRDHAPHMVLTTQNQAAPYSRYITNTKYSGNSLWIQGKMNWTQYAVVPQGSIVPLLAISATKGIGSLNFMDRDEQMYKYNFYFYPKSHMTFYADKTGWNVFSFACGNMSSNTVIIYVTAANQAFNLQYHMLQQQMQDESRRFSLLSNITKAKHDSAKNSIGNIR